MKTTITLILFILSPFARAAYDVPDSDFVAAARPLIEAFVNERNAEYGTRVELVPDTWRVRASIYGMHPLDYAVLFGTRLDGSCREVSAVVNQKTGARARFHIKLTHDPVKGKPKELGPARFTLVGDCATNTTVPKPPQLLIDGLPRDRIFRTSEFAAIAKPLIKDFLRANGRSDVLDESTLVIRKRGVDFDNGLMRQLYRKVTGRARATDRVHDDDDKGSFSWTYRLIFGRNLACRRVRVLLPEESAVFTTYVSVWYKTDELAPNIPATQQTIYRDPLTFRPYRFALANGCDRFGLFEPPTLKLISVPRPTPPEVKPAPTPEPKPEPTPSPEPAPAPESLPEAEPKPAPIPSPAPEEKPVPIPDAPDAPLPVTPAG